MFEATLFGQASLQRFLPCVAERWVAQVMGQRNRFGQFFVQAQLSSDGPTDLGDFQRMCETCTMVIARMTDQYLCLLHEPTEAFTVYQAVPVALIGRTERMLRFHVLSSLTLAAAH